MPVQSENRWIALGQVVRGKSSYYVYYFTFVFFILYPLLCESVLSLLFSGTPGFDRVGGLARSSNPYWVGEDDEANYELLTARDLVSRYYEIIRHVHEIESRDRFTFEKRSCHSRATFFVRRFKNVRRKEKSVELSRIITKKKKKKRKTKGKSKRKKK